MQRRSDATISSEHTLLHRVHAFIQLQSPEQRPDLFLSTDYIALKTHSYADLRFLNVENPASFLGGMKSLMASQSINRPTSWASDLIMLTHTDWTHSSFNHAAKGHRKQRGGLYSTTTTHANRRLRLNRVLRVLPHLEITGLFQV